MKLPRLSDTQGPIARGTIRTSLVLGLRLVVQTCTLLLLARMLGPSQFGAFAGVAALAVILGTFSTFGTHLVLLGEVSKDPTRSTQVLPYAIPTTILCGTLLLIVYISLCTYGLSEVRIRPLTLVAIGAAEILLQPMLGFSVVEHLGHGRIARSQLLMIVPLAIRLLAIATIALVHPTDPLNAYALGYFAASALAASFAYTTLPTRWLNPRDWRLPHWAELHEAMGYAALNITRAGPAELDKTLATKLLPLAASGLYAAGARLIGAAILPIVAMMISALPRLFREGRDQPQSTTRLLRWIFSAALGYSSSIAVLLWFIAPAFVWVFGPKYDGIDHVVQMLVFAAPGMALRTVAGNALMALGKPWMRVGFEAGGIIVLVICAVALVPSQGPLAMPLALASSEWIMAVSGIALIALARNNHGFHARLPT